jgi:hypothetical protein
LADNKVSKGAIMADERDEEQEKKDREEREGHESESYEGEEESGGEAATPDAEMDMGAEQGPQEPPGHAEWLANFEYALQTNPTLYGLAQLYEHMMADQGGQEEQPVDPQAAEEAATQEAMSGGAEEVPLPEGEQKPEEALAMQNSDQVITYAEAFEQVANAIGGLRQEIASLKSDRTKKDAELAKLTLKAAEKDTDNLIYQLEYAGVKALGDPKKKAEIKKKLLGMNEVSRKAEAAQILAYWEKDEAVQYAAKGAPIGDFLQITDQKVNSGKGEAFGKDSLDKARDYMKKNPKATWEQCKQYAMTGEVVVNN